LAKTGTKRRRTSRFLIATACLANPADALAETVRRGLPSERCLLKGRFERRRLLAGRNIRCSGLPDKQKVEPEKIAVTD